MNNSGPTAADLVADPSKLSSIDPAALPAILTQLSTLTAAVAARLTAQPPTQGPTTENRLLKADQAAALLNVSTDFLYRSDAAKPFRVKLGTEVRFSLRGIHQYIERHRG